MSRAAWLIRVVYLNMVGGGSGVPTGLQGSCVTSPGFPPHPASSGGAGQQAKEARSSVFTQHLVEFLDKLLLEASRATSSIRVPSSQASRKPPPGDLVLLASSTEEDPGL